MALDNYVLHDVFEVLVIERDGAGAVVDSKFIGYTSETGFSHSVEQETIKAGIGHKAVAQLFKGKDVSFKLTNAVGSDSLLEMQVGSKFETATRTLAVTERAKIVSDGSEGAKVVLTKMPATIVGKPVVLDNNNVEITGGEYTSSSKTIAWASDATHVGKSVVVSYFVEKTNVEVLAIGADTFPTARELHARSIIYDNETNRIIANVHYVLPKAMPDGNVERSQSSGENSNDSINFTALADEKGNYAYYIVEPIA